MTSKTSPPSSASLRRGDIWLANLNPRKGGEPGKTRPVLIVQNQGLLDAGHPTTIIIPLTTNLIEDAYPLRVRIKAVDLLPKDSDLLIDQVRAIDNTRLLKGPLTRLKTEPLRSVDAALAEIAGL